MWYIILIIIFILIMILIYQDQIENREKIRIKKKNILNIVDRVAKIQGVYGGWTHMAIRRTLEKEL